MLREYETNKKELDESKRLAEQHVKTLTESQKKMTGKEMSKLLEPEIQATFKNSEALKKAFKKGTVPTNEFVKQFVKAKASFYEG